MSKVTVIGAGNVGATCVNALAARGVASEVVLVDIKEGFAEGKILDMYQTSTLLGLDTRLTGVTNDYSATAGSDVIVVTSGIPRKPGMTREELIGVNAGIVKGVVESALKYSPDAVLLVVSNPMDTMTYLAYKTSGLPARRVIGMGGALDSARFRAYLAAELGANINEIDGMVIGGHGDTIMIPLVEKASWRGMPVSGFLSAERLAAVAQATKVGGATLTGLLGTSAWYAPGAAAASVVDSIINDRRRLIPSCVALDGEYGHKDICIGVPAIIGRGGVERIVEIPLSKTEKEAFEVSADAVRKTNSVLGELKVL